MCHKTKYHWANILLLWLNKCLYAQAPLNKLSLRSSAIIDLTKYNNPSSSKNITKTRSTQRAQTSLAEADHYSHILPTVKMLSLGCERLPPPPLKKKKKKALDHYLHHDLGMLALLWCFFCSFTHLTIPISPPKFNQFFLVLLWTLS